MTPSKGKGETSAHTARMSATEVAKLQRLGQLGPDGTRSALLIYSGDGVQVVPLVEGRSVVIGRAEPANVIVRHSSLSRQHASVELCDGEVWIEDLDSTNGTTIDGTRIERSQLDVGSELRLGAVAASVHVASASDGRHGLVSHDEFQLELEAEVVRARTFGRNVALLMFRAAPPDKQAEPEPIGHSFARIRAALRPFDRMALYSASTVEVLLAEADEAQARAFASTLLVAAPLWCGLAAMPEHAGSALELIEATRIALQQATGSRPIEAPPAHDARGGTSTELDDSTKKGPLIHSAAMKAVYRTAEKLAGSVIPVLIVGETGTGKEVVARRIHEASRRSQGPLRCINCGAIPAQLVESTLFGHEKGAFTGAGAQNKGLFEAAAGGTVLLDEIGELPAAAQAALLRVLESKVVTRVGSSKEIAVDVRVLAATHRDLEQMCASGDFREDLLYRLNAMTLEVPPLRERSEEIAPFTRLFLVQANRANDCRVESIDDDAMALLGNYAWPGNVRELRNAIERAVVIAQDEVITPEDLPARVRAVQPAAASAMSHTPSAEPGDGGAAEPSLTDAINLKTEVGQYEAKLILAALNSAEGDRKRAAEQLGLPVRTLAHKMQIYGIKKSSYDRQGND